MFKYVLKDKKNETLEKSISVCYETTSEHISQINSTDVFQPYEIIPVCFIQ
jgi:hypothetical protein